MLPANYKVPTNSNYYRLKDGANKFRVVGKAVVGWVYWSTENKPVRMKEHPGFIPKDVRLEDDGKTPSKIKHFWAFPVYNFDEKRVQIMEITQSTIQDQIVAYENNPDWGDVQGYNLTINRSGTGFDTEYLVQPSPATELAPEVKRVIEATKIRLEALFDGSDPFGGIDTASEANEADPLDAFTPSQE